MADHSINDEIVTLPALGTFKAQNDVTYAASSHTHQVSDITGAASYAAVSVTIPANGWSNGSQTVNCSAVSSSSDLLVAPAPSSIQVYAASKVCCSAQGSGTLTFICSTAPSVDVTANIIVLNGAAS